MTAQRIFNGLVLTRLDSRRDYGEVRCVSVRQVDSAVIVVVQRSAAPDRSATRIPKGEKEIR